MKQSTDAVGETKSPTPRTHQYRKSDLRLFSRKVIFKNLVKYTPPGPPGRRGNIPPSTQPRRTSHNPPLLPLLDFSLLSAFFTFFRSLRSRPSSFCGPCQDVMRKYGPQRTRRGQRELAHIEEYRDNRNKNNQKGKRRSVMSRPAGSGRAPNKLSYCVRRTR